MITTTTTTATTTATATTTTTAANASDEALMDRYCAGDGAAFDELWKRYASRLLRFTRQIVGPTQAADVVQVTFMKLHESRSRYQSGARLSSWLYTIARNTALDHVRSAPVRREKHVDVEARTDDARRDLFAIERVRLAMAQLPADQREVLRLHWFHELPFDDVGQALKASSVAVRARAHRAYSALRVSLAGVASA